MKIQINAKEAMINEGNQEKLEMCTITCIGDFGCIPRISLKLLFTDNYNKVLVK